MVKPVAEVLSTAVCPDGEGVGRGEENLGRTSNGKVDTVHLHFSFMVRMHRSISATEGGEPPSGVSEAYGEGAGGGTRIRGNVE